MRSSGRTTVSRTRVRIDSVRRRRRGRRTGASVRVSVGWIDVAIVVIAVSVEKGPGTLGGAESPPRGPVDAVGAEAFPAGGATLEDGTLLGGPAPDAPPPFFGHSTSPRRRNFPRRATLSISSDPTPPGGVAQFG